MPTALADDSGPLVPLDGPLPQDRPTFHEDLRRLYTGKEISAARIRFVAEGGAMIRFHFDQFTFEGYAPFRTMDRKLQERVDDGLYVVIRIVDPLDEAHGLPRVEILSIED